MQTENGRSNFHWVCRCCVSAPSAASHFRRRPAGGERRWAPAWGRACRRAGCRTSSATGGDLPPTAGSCSGRPAAGTRGRRAGSLGRSSASGTASQSTGASSRTPGGYLEAGKLNCKHAEHLTTTAFGNGFSQIVKYPKRIAEASSDVLDLRFGSEAIRLLATLRRKFQITILLCVNLEENLLRTENGPAS